MDRLLGGQKLKKIPVHGGAPITLCDASALRGAWWGEDGTIVASLEGSRLSRVPSAGGPPQFLPMPETQARVRWPQVLPGAEAVLFTSGVNAYAWNDADLAIMNIKTGQSKIVQRGGYFGRYLPSGHLVYVHEGTLFAVRFDLSRLEVRGTPVPVLDDVAASVRSGAGQFDFSLTGTFAHLSGKGVDAAVPVELLDASGKKEQLFADAATPQFSPDGRRLAFSSSGAIVVYDLDRGASFRLPQTSTGGLAPVWTSDGKHIVHSSGLGLAWLRSDGSQQPQIIYHPPSGGAMPGSISPDGCHLAIHQIGNGTSRDLWILPLDTTDADHPKVGTPDLFVATKRSGCRSGLFAGWPLASLFFRRIRLLPRFCPAVPSGCHGRRASPNFHNSRTLSNLVARPQRAVLCVRRWPHHGIALHDFGRCLCSG